MQYIYIFVCEPISGSAHILFLGLISGITPTGYGLSYKELVIEPWSAAWKTRALLTLILL